MGHQITAILLKGPYDPALALEHDLWAVPMKYDLTLFWTHLFHAEYWQHRLGITGFLDVPPVVKEDMGMFPDHRVIAHLMARITATQEPLFAVIATDYFGGVGDQGAALYRGETLIPGSVSINAALQGLGVVKQNGLDEFDTLGLSQHRRLPDEFRDLIENYPDVP